MSKRQYRLTLYDADGNVIKDAEHMHSSDETPLPGLRIELPQGTWFVHEIVTTWSETGASQLLGSDPHYGGTLICRPEPPETS